MMQGFHEGSHGRAQKILDLLTMKGQKLTIGNRSKFHENILSQLNVCL